MADITISSLPAGTPSGNLFVPISDSSTTYRAPLSDIQVNYNSLVSKPTIPTQTSQLTNNSGYMPSIQTGSAPYFGIRAWVRFSGANDVNGTASSANTDRQIIASGNITRVNRTSLGNYDIYITTGFANTNYSVVANIVHAVGATTAVHIDAYSSTSSLVKAWCSYQPNTISYDPSGVDVWIIG